MGLQAHATDQGILEVLRLAKQALISAPERTGAPKALLVYGLCMAITRVYLQHPELTPHCDALKGRICRSLGRFGFVHTWLFVTHDIPWSELTPVAVWEYRLRWCDELIREYEEKVRAQEG